MSQVTILQRNYYYYFFTRNYYEHDRNLYYIITLYYYNIITLEYQEHNDNHGCRRGWILPRKNNLLTANDYDNKFSVGSVARKNLLCDVIVIAIDPFGV